MQAATNKVFVSGLDWNVSEDDLKDFFSQNKVRVIKLVLFRNDQGQSKGTGIVEFSSNQDADYVVKSLNGSALQGRTVSFCFDRQAGGPPSGGYGRGKF